MTGAEPKRRNAPMMIGSMAALSFAPGASAHEPPAKTIVAHTVDASANGAADVVDAFHIALRRVDAV